MKRKQMKRILLAAAGAALLTGCGAIPGSQKKSEDAQEQIPEIYEDEDFSDEFPDDSESMDGDSMENGAPESAVGAWLPPQAERVYSERNSSIVIGSTIIDHFNLPEEEWEENRYYYNYVNLDDDDDEEIFALLVGPAFSGSGGFTGLWMEPSDNMAIVQEFTLVNNPIFVTDDANGQGRGLIMERSGGGAGTELVLLTFDGKNYCSVSDAEPIEDVSDIEGTAILCDDLAEDMMSGDFMTLAD